ncbi:hypothetical protein V3C99_014754 [Haemonchus contortus]
MDLMCLGSILINTLSNSFGIIFNALLVFLVLKKTPQQLKTYSILIFNFALCDLFACSAAVLIQERVISGGKQLYLIFHGPCRLVGSEFCFVIHSFALHCYTHTLWSLLFSFSYRFYVLKRTPPKNSVVVAIILVIYLPSLLQFISFCFANEKEAELRVLIKENFGYDVLSECVGGSGNILSWRSLPTVLHMTLSATPIYIAIHVIRKLTISLLDMGLVMSENILNYFKPSRCRPVCLLSSYSPPSCTQLNSWISFVIHFSNIPVSY